MINKVLEDHLKLIQKISTDTSLLNKIEYSIEKIVRGYGRKNKLLLCGNGGSASDAQHIAAELTGRYLLDRPALDAEALHVNSAYMTAVANDFGYDHVYVRALQAKANKGDILIVLSTSGNSLNIINAVYQAREMGLFVIGMTGSTGGRIAELCDILINVPSDETPRIQEAHIMIGHILCEGIETAIFNL